MAKVLEVVCGSANVSKTGLHGFFLSVNAVSRERSTAINQISAFLTFFVVRLFFIHKTINRTVGGRPPTHGPAAAFAAAMAQCAFQCSPLYDFAVKPCERPGRGYGGRTFGVIKFRIVRLAPAIERALNSTRRDDPRVFPFGRFPRRANLDELPRLLNVLCGDMRLIGPPPHSALARTGGRIHAGAVQAYAARHRIKPGITGWAQPFGWCGPTDMLEHLRRRVERDRFRIENWSTLFGDRILLRTLLCAVGQKKAF